MIQKLVWAIIRFVPLMCSWLTDGPVSAPQPMAQKKFPQRGCTVDLIE